MKKYISSATKLTQIRGLESASLFMLQNIILILSVMLVD